MSRHLDVEVDRVVVAEVVVKIIPAGTRIPDTGVVDTGDDRDGHGRGSPRGPQT